MMPASIAPRSESTNKYRFLAEIGRGGMADVFLAVTAAGIGRFQKLVVIKLLRSDLAGEQDFLAMFLDEARLAARLNHPNVVQTNEVGEDSGRFYIAMEYLEGQTLERIRRHPDFAQRFPLKMRLHVLCKILHGLHYAHELRDYDGTQLQVVHRDVTPTNIFVTYEGHAKLMDFGIAKALDSSSETRVGVMKGKVAYMAPEQFARAPNGPPLDRRADVYAAGVLLWEMLTGTRMWKSVSQAELMQRVLAGQTPLPSSLVPGLPRELEQICLRALARRPEDRYPSAEALALELERILNANAPAVTERDISQVVSEMFVSERAQVQAVLEAQLKRGGSEKAGSASLPDLGEMLSSGSTSALNSVPRLPDRSVNSYSNMPPSMQVSSSVHLQTDVSSMSASLRPEASNRRRWMRIGAVLGGIVVLGALSWTGVRMLSDSSAATATVDGGAASPAAGQAGAVRGVTDTEITLGLSAAFSGPLRDMGEDVKLGLETAFSSINERGGVHGRKLKLIALDDGYDDKRAATNVTELVERRGVFAVLADPGTATAQSAVPIASSHKTLFFGPITGAKSLRQEPPDRYVFNYRASYGEETARAVDYLVSVKKVAPSSIVVFAQNDAYGENGFEGVVKAMRKHGLGETDILRVSHERNSLDVDRAVSELMTYHNTVGRAPGSSEVIAKHPVRAVILVSTAKPAARFIQKLKAKKLDALLVNVSFGGSNEMVEELKELGPGLSSGVIVTQVVPHYESGGTGVLRYREALKKYYPDQSPGFISLESYIVGVLFAKGLERAGRDLSNEKLVEAFESIRDLDLGIGTILSFAPSEHQASHKVWGTVVDDSGAFKILDME